MVCPGVGEYRLGHRLLGAVLATAFLAVCGWLIVGTYSSVNEISEYVKSQDPTLNLPPAGGAESAAFVSRLFSAIFAEYKLRRAAIHQRLATPLWILFFLYIYSLVQSFVLGVRKDRESSCPS